MIAFLGYVLRRVLLNQVLLGVFAGVVALMIVLVAVRPWGVRDLPGLIAALGGFPSLLVALLFSESWFRAPTQPRLIDWGRPGPPSHLQLAGLSSRRGAIAAALAAVLGGMLAPPWPIGVLALLALPRDTASGLVALLGFPFFGALLLVSMLLMHPAQATRGGRRLRWCAGVVITLGGAVGMMLAFLDPVHALLLKLVTTLFAIAPLLLALAIVLAPYVERSTRRQ